MPLRFADPARQFIIVDGGGDAAAEAALLASSRVALHSDWGKWHIECEVAEPHPVMHEGSAAVRLRFPDAMSSRRRRASERIRVPSVRPLRCVAAVDGVVFFEAEVCDISAGGVGVLQFRPEISLDAGTIIRGCHIERAGRSSVDVDLEIRYTGPASTGEGRPVKRAECRFRPARERGGLTELLADLSRARPCAARRNARRE